MPRPVGRGILASGDKFSGRGQVDPSDGLCKFHVKFSLHEIYTEGGEHHRRFIYLFIRIERTNLAPAAAFTTVIRFYFGGWA